MRRLLFSTCLLSCVLLAGTTVFPASHHSYKVVHGWPSIPDGYALGQTAGVVVDSHNHVWVFHRRGKPILCFDADSGALLNSFGDGLFESEHGIAVDSQDNIWVTDTSGHQVFQFSHEGKLLLTLGTKKTSGQDATHFNRPADVAITPDGTVFVADGYGNSRVAKFDSKGQFEMEWGQKGDKEGEFNVPHGIALDGQGRLYVADRGNARIQVFDQKGTFLHAWKSEELGRPWGVEVSSDGFLFVADGGDESDEWPVRNRAVKLDLEGNIQTKWGSYGSYDGQFYWAHDIAVGPDGAVYVVDVHNGMRVQKFVSQ